MHYLACSIAADCWNVARMLPWCWSTRIHRPVHPSHPLPHLQSSMDCVFKTLRNKGPLEFYTGFATYCVRISPHAALTLCFVAWLPQLQVRVLARLFGEQLGVRQLPCPLMSFPIRASSSPSTLPSLSSAGQGGPLRSHTSGHLRLT